MTKDDYLKFCELWGSANKMFNREVDKEICTLAYKALQEFELKEITVAMSRVLKRSKFAPTIADIVSEIEVMYGNDKASLEIKANEFYNAINRDFSMAKDYVCEDPRAVYAFKIAFGSLQEFGSHSVSADAFDRKAFIQAYVNAKETSYALDREKHLLKGIYHYGERVPVRFIGNVEKCKLLARKALPNKQIMLPDLQTNKPKQIGLRVEKVESTEPMDREKFLEVLGGFLSMFGAKY